MQKLERKPILVIRGIKEDLYYCTQKMKGRMVGGEVRGVRHTSD